MAFSSYTNSHFDTDFEIIRKLGEGGFGVVFEAKNKIDDYSYAVKIIRLCLRETSNDEILREVKILAKLDHPNIVRYCSAWIEDVDEHRYRGSFGSSSSDQWYKDTDDTQGFLYNNSEETSERGLDTSSEKRLDASYTDYFYNMSNDEYEEESGIHYPRMQQYEENISVPRKSLSHLFIQMELCCDNLQKWLFLEKKRDKVTVLNMFHQIVCGVEYIHSKGLIHRDIKPPNILFSSNRNLKIGDFGLARYIMKTSGTTLEHDVASNVTLTAGVGTYLYCAPEQAKRDYDCKVDIYPLGLIFFELLVPFETENECYANIVQLRRNTFPDSFCQMHKKEYIFLQEILHHDSSQRPSASDIKAWLENTKTNQNLVIQQRGQETIQTGTGKGMPLYMFCSLCQKEFKQKCTLIQHGCVHIEARPYYCKECFKRFHQQSHLMQHLRTHSQKKSFKCTSCGKDFYQEAHLKEHKCDDQSLVNDTP